MAVKLLPLSEDAIAWCREHLGIEEFPPHGPDVPRDRLVELARALKDDLHFHFFVTVVAVHHLPEGTEGEEGYLPDRTAVAYRVRRLPHGDRKTENFMFRVWVPTGETTPSMVPFWQGADWQEREQFDLVGTLFDGHPDLRRFMMPDDWVGHPLRRDYAINTSHYPWR
jgi:NADH-quinone oxidoreductase subunit C